MMQCTGTIPSTNGVQHGDSMGVQDSQIFFPNPNWKRAPTDVLAPKQFNRTHHSELPPSLSVKTQVPY